MHFATQNDQAELQSPEHARFHPAPTHPDHLLELRVPVLPNLLSSQRPVRHLLLDRDDIDCLGGHCNCPARLCVPPATLCEPPLLPSDARYLFPRLVRAVDHAYWDRFVCDCSTHQRMVTLETHTVTIKNSDMWNSRIEMRVRTIKQRR